MIVAVFTETVTLGSVVLGALASIALLVGVFYGTRYKVSYLAASAAAEELRKSLADEKERGREEKETAAAALLATQEKYDAVVAQLRDSLTAAQKTIAQLEQMPDMASLVRLLDQHETRAQERHEATTEVLRALADSVRRHDTPTEGEPA